MNFVYVDLFFRLILPNYTKDSSNNSSLNFMFIDSICRNVLNEVAEVLMM